MKCTLKIILIGVGIVGFFSCGRTSKSTVNKIAIDENAVDFVTIKRHQDINHTVVHKPIRLTDSQTKIIIQKLNSSEGTGLCIFFAEFEMTVYFTDGSARYFRINGRSIKEDSDWCYDLGETDFIEKLLIRNESRDN